MTNLPSPPETASPIAIHPQKSWWKFLSRLPSLCPPAQGSPATPPITATTATREKIPSAPSIPSPSLSRKSRFPKAKAFPAGKKKTIRPVRSNAATAKRAVKSPGSRRALNGSTPKWKKPTPRRRRSPLPFPKRRRNRRNPPSRRRKRQHRRKRRRNPPSRPIPPNPGWPPA